MSPETLYRRLQQHLDSGMPVGFPSAESGIDIKILERLFTPADAEIALELSGIPEPAAAIHKRLKSRTSLAGLTEALDDMARRGLILRFPIEGELRYGKLIFAIGIYERQVKRLTPELERDTRQYMEEAFDKAFHTKKTTQMRVVPVNKTIEVERSVGTHDDIRAYVESSSGPFAKMTCICRHGRDLLGEKCRQTDLRDNCLSIGMAAAFLVDYGTATFITREEMIGLLDAADRDGLVLQPENTKNPLFVCCCCGCCCGVLTSAKRFPNPGEYFSSTFYAEADGGLCQSCGLCQTRCQMDAISDDNGTPVVDRSRCMGCALCVTTCPSGALKLVKKPVQKNLPDDTRALYLRMLQDRYGPWGMAKLSARKLLGMKV